MKKKNKVIIMIVLSLAIFFTACTRPDYIEGSNDGDKKDTVPTEDLMGTSTIHEIGYITKASDGEVYIEKVEFLGLEDEERLRELDVDPNYLDNGYYIHDPNNDPEVLNLSEDTEYRIVNWEDLSHHKELTYSEFMDFLDGENYYDSSEYLLFNVYSQDGKITKLEEQYTP